MSGTANNIKIISSIRFSLFITIDRFYKLFFAEGAFVNHRPDMISPLFFIPLPPSNLRPFGAPPSIGRRECPREPLPLEGAAEHSEAGLASFLGGEAASSLPFTLGKGDRAAVDRVLSQTAYLRRFLFHLYHLLETIFPALFHTARTLSGSLCSPPSPRGEGFVRRYSFSTYACIRFEDAGIAASSYRSLPHWGRGTAQRWIGYSRKRRT